MTQEDRMPLKFELIDKKTGEVASNDLWTIDFVTRKLVYNDFFYALRQAIGATDLSDPKQELYVGDIGEFEWLDNKMTGIIFWNKKALQVAVAVGEDQYLSLHSVLSTFKKLGSRYDPKTKEVMKRAGLENP